MKQESEIQEKVTLYASSIGMIPVRINVVGRKGWPDYGYGYKGRMVFIEYKRPGEKPEPLQSYVHKQLNHCGFSVWVVDDINEGKRALDLWKGLIDNESNQLARLRQDNHRD